jgi:hypothetical protein
MRRIRSFPVLRSDKRDFWHAVWDFFVLFSGISTASNLTRTQGRQIRSDGLFLFRPPEEKKPPEPPRRSTDPAMPPDAPPPHPWGMRVPAEQVAVSVKAEERKRPDGPFVGAPMVLRFAWTSEDLLERNAVKPQSLLPPGSSSADHRTALAPAQVAVELRL